MIIDGENSIMGRLFTSVAKKALLGEKVDVINCEKIIVSGKREVVLKRFLEKKKMGVPKKGPFYSSVPEKFCKRIVRGMVPYKLAKGSEAFDRIRFYRGVPDEFKGKEAAKYGIKELKVSYVSVAEICRFIGGKA